MNRGRTPARGTRRGRAAAGTRPRGGASASADAAASSDAPGEASTATARSTPSATTRGAATARATRAPSAGRFRPKVIRRDEAERDTLARQEEQKANERAAEERRARGRSRFRSKRSRGDAMGRGGFGRPIAGASGPFSSGAAGSSRSGGWFGGGGGGGGGGGSGFGGGGSGSFGRAFKSDPSGPGFAQADGRFREARINADKLNVNTPTEELDSEDEAMIAALSARTSTLPMGIYRREHKDTGIVVATTAELEAAENANNGEEESLWVDGDSEEPPVIVDQPEDGVWATDSKKPVVVKEEPGLDDSMDLDTTTKTPEDEDEDEKKTPVDSKPKKALPQDIEEKEIQSDMQLLANELGAITITEDGETKTTGPSNKDGRMNSRRPTPEAESS
ncbi:hypothetical protein G7046_g9294 [Stylonectria norvegica]|nr:hypothetical protein G7046_g9294 [Stylonectria norvegica]